MSSTLLIQFDTSEVQHTMREFARRFPKAVLRARRRALVSARARLARDVAADMKLKVGVVKEALTVTETPGVATIHGRFHRIELYDYLPGSGDPRGPFPSRGKRVLLIRGKAYPGAFVARMTRAGESGRHGGHWGVYRRLGASTRASEGAWSKNLPIVKLKGASVWWSARKNASAAQAVGLASWQKNLASELHFAANVEGK